MIIKHNLPTMKINRFLDSSTDNVSKSLEKSSSGLCINKADDDESHALSEKMRAQIRGLDIAAKNAQSGISLIQIAEGSMQTIEDILHRMRELAVQSSIDTGTAVDRSQMVKEVTALTSEISRIAQQIQFKTMNLLDGNCEEKFFHIDADTNQNISVTIKNMSTASLKVAALVAGAEGINLSNRVDANNAIKTIDDALSIVSAARSELGAIQNSIEYSIQNLEVSSENASAAKSRILDVNMVKEMMNFTKSNILSQAENAMLAQANQTPQNVQTLLQETDSNQDSE